jgi:hypothetical protein
MHTQKSSTLIEIHTNLNYVLFEILKALDPDSWQEQKQIVYSTVNDWDTAYQSYLVKNNIEEVKFPFATLTRTETQDSFTQWNAPLTLHEAPVNGNYSVKGVIIRPVRCRFNWTIYTKDYLSLENLVDLLVLSGSEIQVFNFYSEVMKQHTEFGFFFEAPSHNLIPSKEDKLRGHGFIYSLTVPIVLDCVLGVQKGQKLISEIILNSNLANGIITESEELKA